MKTTIEIPDRLFRQAKAAAAQQGISLKEFVTEAMRQRLRSGAASTEQKPWMRGFGALRDLHEETERINRIIEEEFETIDEQDWR